MARILITGDSFAANWGNNRGWPNQLSQTHEVVNLAQAGVGEYKILKQLQSTSLNQYDHIIVSHTSPYRMHTAYHPLHADSKLHKNCDFIYSDVQGRLPEVEKFFMEYWDLEYAHYVHKKICMDIDSITKEYAVIHMNHIDWTDQYQFNNMIDFSNLKKSINEHNHYDKEHNQIICKNLIQRIKSV